MVSLRWITNTVSVWSADAFLSETAEKSELPPSLTVVAVILLYSFPPSLWISVNVFFVSFVFTQQLVPLWARTNYLKGYKWGQILLALLTSLPSHYLVSLPHYLPRRAAGKLRLTWAKRVACWFARSCSSSRGKTPLIQDFAIIIKLKHQGED